MNEAREIVSPTIARRYLTEENGWTEAEAEAFTNSLSEHTSYRTRDEWTRLACEWADAQEEDVPEPHEGRKTLSITIDLEGAAFQEGFADMEVAQMLRLIAIQIERGALSTGSEVLAVGVEFTSKDSNGNTCGTTKVEAR